ncbi:MAG TPA: multicopper oxidase domain-containing protein, partial [Blastocatellia bacterium]|nr:multicopper oxidase domain-containing protein [Blastocatellia bacterium]
MNRPNILGVSSKIVLGAIVFALAPLCAVAQTSPPPCPRFPAGSVIQQAPDIFSNRGVLKVNLTYQTTLDANNNTLFCYMQKDGTQSPTLHVHPGDTIVFTLTNQVPAPTSAASLEPIFSASANYGKYRRWSNQRYKDMLAMMNMGSKDAPTQCGDAAQDASSTNVHYHGTNTSPTCHSDEVIHTLINSGTTFQYQLHIPFNEPPGLYWYHPHVHGLAEAALQGGASGALIVEGIGAINEETEGLPERILMIRDNPIPGAP